MALELPRFTTLADYLDYYAAETPDADAVWHDGTTLSYAELAHRVDRVAGSLAASGPVSYTHLDVYKRQVSIQRHSPPSRRWSETS